MLNLNDLYYFVQVVDHDGFASAARALNVPKSTLSRRVILLESQLGARLIQRTSRQFTVTDAGREFYRHALAAVIEAEAGEHAIRRRHTEPMGKVRFSCSTAIAQFALATLLPRFLVQFPKVHLVEYATNRHVDLVNENIDVAIRAHAGDLPDSGLIQRRLLFSPRWLVASPAYLESAPPLAAPEDLRSHAGLAFGSGDAEPMWRLTDGSEGMSAVSFKPVLHTDDLMTLLSAAKAGLGIASLPAFICRRDLTAGALERVLPNWTECGVNITLLMPSRRDLLPSVRVFVDFLAAELPSAMSGKPPQGEEAAWARH
ncbi:LysR substrate-binding domain-containing protein [Nitratireductor thuwali]|uniref:HTH-type transcriptional regulator DmlR n=1 Tax=Nitratireductor thuwali TaxID=2267699 RepID=A0ABY5MNG7_9HYPH|nr:HTH-type transcriptional regulator DmlR [Nitratireductor thuwali]